MDEMNNHIPEENIQELENQDLENQDSVNQEIETPDNASEPVVEHSTPVSPAPKKPISKKLIIGGLIAIVLIGIIAAVGLFGIAKPPIASTNPNTSKPEGTNLAFLGGFEAYGYTVDQISEMSEILTNVGITSVKNLEVEEISRDKRIARGVCNKAETIELMSVRSSDNVV